MGKQGLGGSLQNVLPGPGGAAREEASPDQGRYA